MCGPTPPPSTPGRSKAVALGNSCGAYIIPPAWQVQAACGHNAFCSHPCVAQSGSPPCGAFISPIHRALEDPNRPFTQFPLPRWMRKWGAALFKSVMAPAIRSFEEEWQEVITKCLLIVTLPHEVLDTDKDVPPLPNGDMYPAALTSLTLPETKALVAELDYTPDTTQGSGARNWVRLGDRMNYVVDFFRSRQQDRDLLLSPFTQEQVKAIYAGRLPEGPL